MCSKQGGFYMSDSSIHRSYCDSEQERMRQREQTQEEEGGEERGREEDGIQNTKG